VIKIFGEEYRLRARVETINGYSAHADQKALLEWAKPIAPGLRHAFVVHGDPGPAQILGDGLHRLGAAQVSVPAQGEKFQV
jgi:metallo-beta-lactamase family protein